MSTARSQIMLIVSAFLIAGFTVSFTACGSSDVSNPKPTPSSTQSRDEAYQSSVTTIVERFYNHRKEYNTGMERVGAQYRSARTESEQRLALQQAVTHLENARQWFRQDMDDFARILPPAKFQDAHLLMNSVLRDYVDAITSFVTYYSQNLNLGTQDLQLANRASALLRTANENRQRAALMYADLMGKK